MEKMKISSGERITAAVFIDSENTSSRECHNIISVVEKYSKNYKMWYYARRDEPSTECWKKMGYLYDIEPVLIGGGPRKNKVDNKMMKDIKIMINNNNSIKYYFIVTCDGDFKRIVEYIRNKKKKVKIIVTGNVSAKLSNSAEVIRI